MKNIFLVISIKEKKTKIAVFQIDKNNDIFINEVHIIKSFILKYKVIKPINKIFQEFAIYQVVISVYTNCTNPSLKALEELLSSFTFDRIKLFNQLFIINESIKVISDNGLKNIETKLKYIKNSWLDFTQIEHIDLNGLIHYKLNNRK
jgi:hypothetical protein